MSPYTQYFVCKLLRRYLAESQPLTPHLKVADPAQSDFSKVLRSLCRSESAFLRLTYELESLIESYSRFESQQSRHSPVTVKAELAKLERKILHLLGLRLGQMLPERLPVTVSEAAGVVFRFCLDSGVQSGMCYHNRFYGLLRRWPNGTQFQAYQAAWTLAHKGIACLITRTPEGESAIWINLQSPSSTVLLQQGEAILPSLLKMHPMIWRREAMIAS